jgi:hypothetical protein
VARQSWTAKELWARARDEPYAKKLSCAYSSAKRVFSSSNAERGDDAERKFQDTHDAERILKDFQQSCRGDCRARIYRK